MFTDIETFLRYFDGVHRRALRDIGALPAEAESYRPETGEGEGAWSIGELVRHMAGSRLYFARAYRGEGWVFDYPLRDCVSQTDWLPCLKESMAEFRRRLEGTPSDWLARKIRMIDTDGELSGWRVLMMCLEHDVHHTRASRAGRYSTSTAAPPNRSGPNASGSSGCTASHNLRCGPLGTLGSAQICVICGTVDTRRYQTARLRVLQ